MVDLKNIGQKQATFLREAYQKKQLDHSNLFVDKYKMSGLNTPYCDAYKIN